MKTLEFDHEQCAVMGNYHSGQSSMLYAVSSTGALSVGSVRLRHDGEDRYMTPEEQFKCLLERLESEVDEAIRLAHDHSGHSEEEELDACNEAALLQDALTTIQEALEKLS